MGRRKKSPPPEPPMKTRSSTRNAPAAEINYYTTLKGDKNEDRVRVVSRRPLKADPRNHARIKAKFDLIGDEKSESGDDNSINGVVSIVVHVNIFLYAACFFIQTGTLPYLSKKLGADPNTFGLLQTSFAVAQLLGGPIFGRLGDICGERLALLVAFSSAALSYTLMGLSYSLPVLFLSRLPSVFMHVMQASQMIATHYSAPERRSTALSRLGFAYGIGMVVGPSVGGIVVKTFDERFAAFVAAVGSVISIVLVVLFIPAKKVSTKDKRQKSVLDLKAIGKLLLAPGAIILLAIKLVSGFPIGILQSMFSVIAMERFELPPDRNGMVMSYIGVISLVMQGLGISFISALFTERSLMNGTAVVLAAAFYGLTLIQDLQSFLAVLLPLVSCMCLINSIVTGAVTKTVAVSDTGAILGLNMLVHSGIRSVSPTIGGYVMTRFGYEVIGYIGVVCSFAVILLVKLVPAFKH